MGVSTVYAKELLRRTLNLLRQKWFTTPPPQKEVPQLSAPTRTVPGGIECSVAAEEPLLPNVTRSNGLIHKTVSGYESMEPGSFGWINFTTACGLNVKHHPGLRRRTSKEPVTCLMCLAR